jgi:hypothetical protein
MRNRRVTGGVMGDVFDYVDLMTPLPSYALSRPAEAILWRGVAR